MDMHVGMLGVCRPPLLYVLAMVTLDNHLTQQEELTLTPLKWAYNDILPIQIIVVIWTYSDWD